MAVETEQQVSAGGVVFRGEPSVVEVVLVSVGRPARWQLPKGLVEAGESPAEAAKREVREETGVDGEVLEPLDAIEYWYQATRDGRRVRYHKRVLFYLMAARGGDVTHHDHEVHEARWFPLAEAVAKLAFASERRVVEQGVGVIKPRAG